MACNVSASSGSRSDCSAQFRHARVALLATAHAELSDAAAASDLWLYISDEFHRIGIGPRVEQMR